MFSENPSKQNTAEVLERVAKETKRDDLMNLSLDGSLEEVFITLRILDAPEEIAEKNEYLKLVINTIKRMVADLEHNIPILKEREPTWTSPKNELETLIKRINQRLENSVLATSDKDYMFLEPEVRRKLYICLDKFERILSYIN